MMESKVHVHAQMRDRERSRRKSSLILDGSIAPPHLHGEGSLPFLEPPNSCVMCNKSSAFPCKRCENIWYCGQDCQKSDWPSHRIICDKLTRQPPRPTPDHRRALFFPDEQLLPQVIWLHCPLDGSTNSQRTETEPYLGSGIKETMRFEENALRKRTFGYPPKSVPQQGYSIHLKFRENFFIDGAPQNMSISSSLRPSGIAGHPWRGPMVAIRFASGGTYDDITMGDFRHIIDHLIAYPDDWSHTRDITSLVEED